MTWRDLPIGGFDLETTGTDPESARVVTACAILTNTPSGWIREWTIDPGIEIPAEATAVHGVTNEQVNADGSDPFVALAQVADALAEIWAAGYPVIGHNIVYDLTVLDRDLRRNGLPPLTVAGPVVDTLVLDKAVDKYRKGSRKLADVAAHHGIMLDQAHNATADTIAACRVAYVLAGRFPGRSATRLGDMDLADLHTWQAAEYRRQAESFAAYRTERGTPLGTINTHWPLTPAQTQGATA